MKHAHTGGVIGVCAGVWMGENLGYSSAVFVGAIVSMLLVGISIWMFKKRSAVYDSAPLLNALMVALLFVSIAIVRVQMISPEQLIPQALGEISKFEIIIEDEGSGEAALQYPATLFYGDKKYHALLTLQTFPLYNVGDVLTIEGKLEKPRQQLPTKEEGTVFDYDRYLQLKGYDGVIIFPKIISSTSTELLTFGQKLIRIRVALTSTLEKFVPKPESDLANSVLFGAAHLSKEDKQLFQHVGISHIVALSGFNIAIIIILFGFLFRYVPLYLRVLLTIIGILLFVGMVGLSASVLRATIMALFALLALTLGSTHDVKRVFFLTIILATLYDPRIILYDVSFILSCLATLGVLVVDTYMRRIVSHYSMMRKTFLEAASLTLSTTFTTLPYVLYTFGTVSLVALPVNLLVVPLVPILMVLTALTVLTGAFFSSLGGLFGYLTYLISGTVYLISRLFNDLPFASVAFHISYFEMILMYVLGGILFLKLYNYILIKESVVFREGNIIEGEISF